MRSIFQLSIDAKKPPKDRLSANVSPVFKKGDIHVLEKYRPFPPPCVSCKLLEHIICKHILDHLEKNKNLTSLNHGFRSGYSCETQLVTTIHNLLGKYDVGTQIDVVIVDLLCVQRQSTASGKLFLTGIDIFLSSHSLFLCIYTGRPCNIFIQIQIQTAIGDAKIFCLVSLFYFTCK